jgi:hypothetical protein
MPTGKKRQKNTFVSLKKLRIRYLPNNRPNWLRHIRRRQKKWGWVCQVKHHRKATQNDDFRPRGAGKRPATTALKSVMPRASASFPSIAATILTSDEAWRIAKAIARLPEF